MKLNLQIFDWELSTEDTEKIKNIPQRKGYLGEMFISKDYGPYKSLEEFWDDDIDNYQWMIFLHQVNKHVFVISLLGTTFHLVPIN